MAEIHRHVIYIPGSSRQKDSNGEDSLLSRQLAYAFAKHHSNDFVSNQATMIIEHGLGANDSPLRIMSPNDTLQIMFTPVANLNAPLHEQIKIKELLKQIPYLVKGLDKDGFKPNDCTIQLYTLQHNDQDSILIRELATKLIQQTNGNNIVIEWHVIPQLSSLSPEHINQIFQPSVTCQAVFHAVVDSKTKEIKIMESCGVYSDDTSTTPTNRLH